MNSSAQSKRISWPFYRYKLLMPSTSRGDPFEWLYLSLVSYFNGVHGRRSVDFSEAARLDAKGL